MTAPRSKTTFEGQQPTASRLSAGLNTGKIQKGSAEYQTFIGLINDVLGIQNSLSGALQSLINLIGSDGEVEPETLIGRGNVGAGPLQLITVGDGLEFNGSVLELTRPGDWDFEIIKQSLQDVLDSTTLVNDTELTFDINERDCWYVQLLILYAGNDATGDYKFNFDLPNVNGWIRYIADSDPSNNILVSTGVRLSGANALAASVALGVDTALTPRMLLIEFMLRAGDTGPLTYQFAMNASATDKLARTYEGSILRGRRLSVIPFGQSGPSDPGSGGTGPGAGSNPPTVPFPNDLQVVIDYNTANPGQILDTEVNSDFMNGVVAALQAVDARYGHNYKRGISSGQGFSTDAISYYHGDGSIPPADGDPNVFVIDIVADAGSPSASPAWINVTTPLAAGGYHLGPV